MRSGGDYDPELDDTQLGSLSEPCATCHQRTDNRPDVLSAHVLPEEIDPAQGDVKAVDGLLHVYMPKKNNYYTSPI
jgi:hypothetical protein